MTAAQLDPPPDVRALMAAIDEVHYLDVGLNCRGAYNTGANSMSFESCFWLSMPHHQDVDLDSRGAFNTRFGRVCKVSEVSLGSMPGCSICAPPGLRHIASTAWQSSSHICSCHWRQFLQLDV